MLILEGLKSQPEEKLKGLKIFTVAFLIGLFSMGLVFLSAELSLPIVAIISMAIAVSSILAGAYGIGLHLYTVFIKDTWEKYKQKK